MHKRATKNNAEDAKTARYADLRGRLIRRGYTLRSWALANGYPISSVYSAARGTRAGIKATKIMDHLNRTAYATTE